MNQLPTLGHLDVDVFLPRPERLALARALNAVVASPAFSPWRQGAPLDVADWLTPRARTPVTVLYLAHLDEAQRRFFVTLLLHQVVAWSRRQPGASALRALVYMDEVMGWLPPHPKDPSTKWPVLTLLKQARAVGLGVMLCTQNPVDLDYKAMSNAATWLIGRLQTRQDRARVIDGLATAGVDTARLDDELAGLEPRSFLVRDGGAPRTVRSRHTLAFLRGPLTRDEVASLGRGPTLEAAPAPPDGLPARWLDARGAAAWGVEGQAWQPALVVRWCVRLAQGAWVEDRVLHDVWLAGDRAPRRLPLEDAWVTRTAPPRGRYAALPEAWRKPGAIQRMQEVGREEIVRTEAAEGPGGWVPAERGRVKVGVVALVWVGAALPLQAG